MFTNQMYQSNGNRQREIRSEQQSLVVEALSSLFAGDVWLEKNACKRKVSELSQLIGRKVDELFSKRSTEREKDLLILVMHAWKPKTLLSIHWPQCLASQKVLVAPFHILIRIVEFQRNISFTDTNSFIDKYHWASLKLSRKAFAR